MTLSLTASLIATLAAPLALQAAPTASANDPITSLGQLPISEATAPRCAIAFAIVENWQREGDPAGEAYPDMASSNGREYFVRTLAQLMDRQKLSRDDLQTVIVDEMRNLSGLEGTEKIAAMMPTCLLLKQASGL